MNHPSPALPCSTVLTPQCDRAAAVSPYLLRTQQGCRRTGSGILGPAPGTSPAAHGSVRKPHLLSSLYVKLMILPRQARDKHRKSTQKEMCCLTGHSNASRQAFSFCDAILYLKTIILPRQARDEHRESTQKRRFPHPTPDAAAPHHGARPHPRTAHRSAPPPPSSVSSFGETVKVRVPTQPPAPRRACSGSICPPQRQTQEIRSRRRRPVLQNIDANNPLLSMFCALDFAA